MEVFAIVALVISLALFIVGLSIFAYASGGRKINVLESHLFREYASILYEDIHTHERFENPIKSINSSLNLLQENADEHEHFDKIRKALDRIKDSVGDMKYALDVRDGKEPMRNSAFDLRVSIGTLLQDEYEEQGNNVGLIKGKSRHKFFGTQMEIWVAVRIVINNALQYGGTPISIDLQRIKNRRTRIIISDRGNEKAFHEDTLDKINQINLTYNKEGLWSGGLRRLIADSAETSQGNGSGLIVAHLIAKAYDGGVTLINSGSLFEGELFTENTVVIELSGN